MNEREEAIKQGLIQQFDFLEGKCNVTRARRIFADVPLEHMLDVMTYAKTELGFGSLCTITSLDSGDNYEMVYHLANGGIMLNLKVLAPKANPVFPTVTGLYNGATMYELEAHNLLGLTVEGIPVGIKYPLPDDWPEGQYPLRKDWKKEMPAQSAEGSGQNG